MISSFSHNTWIKYFTPNPNAQLRLFCFPYAGGSAAIFRDWHQELPETIEVCPVELPGRSSRMREPLFEEMSSLIESLGAGLRSYLDKPYVVFGHSFGALVSFELACYCREHHYRLPDCLLVSGRQAPHLLDPSPMHALPKEDFIEQIKRLNGTPQEIMQNPEMMELLVPILRADLKVDETYRYTPKAPLDIPVAVFGGEQDSEASRTQLEAWSQHGSCEFSLQMFPGDHFFINTERSHLLQTLSKKLQDIVEAQ
ncbi:MAG: thioesterase [Roseofilum sp. SBFL]|uniref:thioesterase II family protein n=1 Tax=unclassified Roseofilum TaxID=2620099 RepID=UPI001B2A51FC|nr:MULTISPECIES: alpha/beta fold hydrolase [unclassified Roseofilum]MBP0011788.1 thioesterase [Roseofilum sp. SID3]MBP0023289.1 thioesterase [Roseofilum sp. SID2]MBP0039734.1 thioesterase [Roseofilum sp. SID1]MBP0043679.1 thioesterase [Roseofilum sp. SBFL]